MDELTTRVMALARRMDRGTWGIETGLPGVRLFRSEAPTVMVLSSEPELEPEPAQPARTPAARTPAAANAASFFSADFFM